ncbi:MAG: F0F1 ATP synthase subunit epsilon, partial [Armatimonadota bacterium]
SVRGADGARTYLPRHIDFVTAVLPSVMSWFTPDGEEHFAAIDEGVLVKVGNDLLISAAYAMRGEELGRLREAVEREFRERAGHERATRTALARLEASIVRRFMELGE